MPAQTNNGSPRKTENIGNWQTVDHCGRSQKWGCARSSGLEFKPCMTFIHSLGHAGWKHTEESPSAHHEGFGLRAGEQGDVADGAGNYRTCPDKHGLMADAWDAELWPGMLSRVQEYWAVNFWLFFPERWYLWLAYSESGLGWQKGAGLCFWMF